MSAQQLAALQKANERRTAIVAVKRALRTREITLAQALEDVAVQPMNIHVVLGTQRGWGDRRVMVFCNRVNVSPFRRVGALSPRERALIVSEAGT